MIMGNSKCFCGRTFYSCRVSGPLFSRHSSVPAGCVWKLIFYVSQVRSICVNCLAKGWKRKSYEALAQCINPLRVGTVRVFGQYFTSKRT